MGGRRNVKRAPLPQPAPRPPVKPSAEASAETQAEQKRAMGARLAAKKKPPGGGEFLSRPCCLFFDGVSRVSRCILNIAGGVVGRSLGLIDLAFGFQILVTSELAGTFFYGPFSLVSRPLHVRDP